MSINIAYDIWEMECCGKTLKVDDLAEFPVVEPKFKDEFNLFVKDNNININIDYYYDFHIFRTSYKRYKIKGKISKIEILYSKYNKNTKSSINRFLKCIEETAELVEKTINDCIGNIYIITLENISIEKWKKEFEMDIYKTNLDIEYKI